MHTRRERKEGGKELGDLVQRVVTAGLIESKDLARDLTVPARARASVTLRLEISWRFRLLMESVSRLEMVCGRWEKRAGVNGRSTFDIGQ